MTYDRCRMTYDRCRMTYDRYRKTYDRCRMTYGGYRMTYTQTDTGFWILVCCEYLWNICSRITLQRNTEWCLHMVIGTAFRGLVIVCEMAAEEYHCREWRGHRLAQLSEDWSVFVRWLQKNITVEKCRMVCAQLWVFIWELQYNITPWRNTKWCLHRLAQLSEDLLWEFMGSQR